MIAAGMVVYAAIPKPTYIVQAIILTNVIRSSETEIWSGSSNKLGNGVANYPVYLLVYTASTLLARTSLRLICRLLLGSETALKSKNGN